MNSKAIRRYLLAGLVVWIPLTATWLVISFIVEVLDKTVRLLPRAYQPEQLLGFHIVGAGVILSILVVLLTGLLVTNIIGEKIVSWGEQLVDKIPLVGAIYQAVKQVMETLLSSSSESFRSVLLVEYPRCGLWSLAFQTGNTSKQITSHINKDMITIFIPTTPNPTSGFLMMLPKEDAIFLELSVDEALKMIISLGVMQPSQAQKLAAKTGSKETK